MGRVSRGRGRKGEAAASIQQGAAVQLCRSLIPPQPDKHLVLGSRLIHCSAGKSIRARQSWATGCRGSRIRGRRLPLWMHMGTRVQLERESLKLLPCSTRSNSTECLGPGCPSMCHPMRQCSICRT